MDDSHPLPPHSAFCLQFPSSSGMDAVSTSELQHAGECWAVSCGTRVCVCVLLTLPHPPPSLWIPLTYTRVCAQELLFELFSCQTARYFCDGPGPPACTQAPRTAASGHAGGTRTGATSPLSCPGDVRVLGSPCVFPRGSRFTWPWMEHAPCMGKRRVRVSYTCLFVYLSVCSIVCVCVCLCSVCAYNVSSSPPPPMWYCHCCSGSPYRRNNFGHIDELVRCAYGL